MTFSRKTELKRVPMKRAVAVKEPKKRMRACKVCREKFEPRSMTHKTCGPSCAESFVLAEKARKFKSERQAGLALLKKKGDYLNEAQTAFNAFIRLRDAALPCICCGAFNANGASGVGGGWDAGHWISRGHASHLRFNENNVHKQQKGCNRPGGTTRAKYRLGLVARIGEDAVLELEALEYAPTEKRWTIEELKEIKALYRAKLKELKNGRDDSA
jgi:hypothetical protein